MIDNLKLFWKNCIHYCIKQDSFCKPIKPANKIHSKHQY